MTIDQENNRKVLMRCLWAFEIILISSCFIAGANLALSGGGSIFAALPLILISAAEVLRIPLSSWMVSLRWGGRFICLLVLAAIAVGSTEGLSMAFEQFLNLRVARIEPFKEKVASRQAALAAKNASIEKLTAEQAVERNAVTELAASINTVTSARKAAPSLSGKTCGRDGHSTCWGDRLAQDNYRKQIAADTAQIATLTAERKERQLRLDAISLKLAGINNLAESEALTKAKALLHKELAQSPFHRLASSWWGKSVSDLSESEFETVKRFAIIGLSVAFATASMIVSVAAHMQPSDGTPSKLSRTLRALIARRRKAVVRVVEKQVPTGIKTKVIYVPVNNADNCFPATCDQCAQSA